MSGSGLTVTVVGWAATHPREITGDGVAYTSFRLATTPRRYDAKQGAWTDGRTEWLTVKAFREAALNIAASVHKGDPVVVQGRLRSEEWAGENGPRTTLVLDVVALGHDLTRGRSTFVRSVHVSGGGDGRPGADALDGPDDDAGPVDADDPWATEVAVAPEAAEPVAAMTP